MRAAWASIDALLKRRADLIPNLVAVVRGGMDYEADTLTNAVHARNGVINATDVHDRARSEELLTGAVRQLFALVESYPSCVPTKRFSVRKNSSKPDRYPMHVVLQRGVATTTLPRVIPQPACGRIARI